MCTHLRDLYRFWSYMSPYFDLGSRSIPNEPLSPQWHLVCRAIDLVGSIDGSLIFIAIPLRTPLRTDSCRVAAIVLTTLTYDCDVVSGVSTYAGDLVGTLLAVSRH